MDTEEEPTLLEGQTSIEDLLDEATVRSADAPQFQGCLPGLESVA